MVGTAIMAGIAAGVITIAIGENRRSQLSVQRARIAGSFRMGAANAKVFVGSVLARVLR
jgi:hypothetical protein